MKDIDIILKISFKLNYLIKHVNFHQILFIINRCNESDSLLYISYYFSISKGSDS